MLIYILQGVRAIFWSMVNLTRVIPLKNHFPFTVEATHAHLGMGASEPLFVYSLVIFDFLPFVDRGPSCG